MTHSTRSESIETQYDWSNVLPSMAVVDALASLEDVRPVNLSTVLDNPLYHYIEPEALDSLITNRGAVSISFTIAEYDVQIAGDRLRIDYE